MLDCLIQRVRVLRDSQASEFSDHLGGAPLLPLFGHGGSAFLVLDPLVQDLPDQPTEAVRNRADRLRVSQADDQTAVHELKILPLVFTAAFAA